MISTVVELLSMAMRKFDENNKTEKDSVTSNIKSSTIVKIAQPMKAPLLITSSVGGSS